MLALTLISALSVPIFATLHNDALTQLVDEATADAQLRVQSLRSELEKQRAVAAILADDSAVHAVLLAGGGETAAISGKFEKLRAETNGAVIYLLNDSGLTIAASNWMAGDSFVGGDYSFRHYFSDAIAHGTGLEFALGASSHRPGLYLSHDVRDGDRLLGVVVVKVEFDQIEAVWANSAHPTWVTGRDQQVYLSSQSGDRFAPRRPLPRAMMAISLPIPEANWLLTLGVSTRPAFFGALVATVLVWLLMVTLLAWIRHLQTSRARALQRAEAGLHHRAALEQAVADRTRELRDEMQERYQTQQRLARLQSDLVQANKLATLGQITAGLAHEVNTPLATIRLLAENGRTLLPRRASAELREILDTIVRMSERIARITTELRGFSRKATGHIEPVALSEVIDASILLINSRRRAEPARIILPQIDPELRVLVEAVRLEQVLVNLIQNAHEALTGHPDPEIRIEITVRAARVELRVVDNGPGIAPEIATQLFTPFATSKRDGLGLGLVIAQEIVREFGGELRLEPPQAGMGANFGLDLPRAPGGDSA
jgi:two-component system C4-dicarboxylate transport sensor histidine kinase DctB